MVQITDSCSKPPELYRIQHRKIHTEASFTPIPANLYGYGIPQLLTIANSILYILTTCMVAQGTTQ
jgi:hypothetical protein